MGALVTVAQPVFGMQEMQAMASAIAKGGLFGATEPNAVLTLLLVAQASGKHPATAFESFHIIKGKPAKKADAMLMDFFAAGGKVEWHALSDEVADATFSHPQGGSVRIAWDEARVKQAGLGKPDRNGDPSMHTKFPRAMKRARTVSEGVRTVFPGATSGMYVPEEVEDMTPPMRDATPTKLEQPVIEHKVEQEAKPRQRGLKSAIADLEAMIREADAPEQLDDILAHPDMVKLQEKYWDEFKRIEGMVADRRETLMSVDA